MKSVDVIVNGSRKWDIRVKDERFWRMFVSAGVIGFVDAYQNGYFECDDLCELCYRLTKMDLNKYSIFHPYYYFNCDLEYYFGIQNSDSAYKDGGEGYDKYNDYIEKYMGINYSCPNMNQIVKYTEKLFVVEDWQNYGNHMAIASQQIYEKNKKLKIVLMKEFGEKMFNVWQIVFAISYALYRTRQSHVWQIIFSKSGIEGGYDSEH
ncbi:cyclopropane-fatty-acyl-phospholipid synthase-like protein [Leptotrombidium deliense]|uniref:Cyclopropane-fatty-acyl-phospholipid synthase-like protein n=1 Tax=Leptotrombidium deliense TaxID=299467 RepID=A0A443S7R3_9ACAR|nr:cyclopropane-fatty-acyl-phospholipid synthase-like protein [Leptotrombidium deliense]